MTTKRPRSSVKSADVYAPPKSKQPVDKKPPPTSCPGPAPVRYRYRLAQHTVERLADAWWIIPETAKRQGPFATPQDVCIAIARELCAELSNRHQSLAAFHGVKPGDPLHGLPDAPQLYAPRAQGVAP